MASNARAGKITIDLSAGTTQFVVDMERANAKLNEFGARSRVSGESFRQMGGHAVSSMQATSGALRVLEGNMANNLRAAERFIASIKGVGPALQAAFPLVGSIAVLGILGELYEKANKLYEAFQRVQQAPARIAAAFEPLHTSMELQNADMQVANDKLANEIAKLEHKPQNGLKLALDEAIASSMKLSESLQRNLAEAGKVLKENQTGFLDWALGKASNKDVLERQTQFSQGLKEVERTGQENIIAAGGDKNKLGAATDDLNAKRLAYIDGERKKVEALLSQAKADQANQYIRSPLTGNIAGTRPGWRDQTTKIQSLQDYMTTLRDLSIAATLEPQNQALTQRKDVLTADKTSKPKTDLYAQKMEDFSRELDAATAKATHTGDVIGEALARGAEKGRAAIDEVTRSLAEQGKSLTNQQRLRLTLAAEDVALSEANAALKDKRARDTAEKDKQNFDQLRRQQDEIAAAEERLGREKDEQAAKEQKRLSDLRGDMTALQYASEALYGGREAQFQAQLAGIRAKGREAGTPQPEIDDQIQRATATHAFDLKQMGVGQSASEGFKQFFTQMQDNAKSTGVMVQQTLGAAFEGLNQQLGALITGQKSSWSSFFTGLASQMAQLGLSRLESQFLGSLFGSSKGGGGGFAGILGKLFGGGKAGGGSVDPGKAYLVGENGPEIFSPGSAGSITPNDRLGGGGSGSRPGNLYYIDARGADAASVEQRVQRSLIAVHGSAVRSSAAVQQEMEKRRPRGGV